MQFIQTRIHPILCTSRLYADLSCRVKSWKTERHRTSLIFVVVWFGGFGWGSKKNKKMCWECRECMWNRDESWRKKMKKGSVRNVHIEHKAGGNAWRHEWEAAAKQNSRIAEKWIRNWKWIKERKEGRRRMHDCFTWQLHKWRSVHFCRLPMKISFFTGYWNNNTI